MASYIVLPEYASAPCFHVARQCSMPLTGHPPANCRIDAYDIISLRSCQLVGTIPVMYRPISKKANDIEWGIRIPNPQVAGSIPAGGTKQINNLPSFLVLDCPDFGQNHPL